MLYGAAEALGLDIPRQAGQALSRWVHLETPTGPISAWALIDSGAEGCFLSQEWVRKHVRSTDSVSRMVKALDGHRIRSYGLHRMRIAVADDRGLERQNTYPLTAVDMAGYDVILGMPWLREANPDVNWAALSWRYREASSKEDVQILSAHRAAQKILKGSAAFILRLWVKDGDTYGEPLVAGAITNETGLPAYLEEFADVFSEGDAKVLPERTAHDHPIDLEPGTEPPHKPIYGLTENERKVLREYIRDALEKGWIRESTSPAGAPILFVPKKDGTLRLCVDYRGLNAITIKNRYPLPLITETLGQLAGAKVFTQLDLRDAYHRIRIRSGDEWKTAFRTRYGHFEYMVMPFGLANAPATFQSYINRALSDLLDTCCVVYLDDILIYSSSEEEHRNHVRMVLGRLRQFRLYAKLSKCAFGVDTVSFLGFVVSPDGVTMERDRVQTIQEWPEPTCAKDILSFIGFANFYRRFIEGYSRIAAPLTDLTKGIGKGQTTKHGRKKAYKIPFVLADAARRAFEELKAAFCKAPLLRHFNPEYPIQLETDASGEALSGIVSQKQPDDNLFHPIAFWSRKLTGAEINYEIHDSELLAIVESFRHWRQYLEGSRFPVTVWSDHANLRYFMTTKELNRRQARWAEKLAAFDFVIEHRPGSKNPADAPSRRPDYMASITKHTLLPTLQEKLRRGIFGNPEASQEVKDLVAGLMAYPGERCVPTDLETCGQKNAPVDESCAAGVTRDLELLVPRSVVISAI
jgi:RNase H-like domain found in reverse transcriptase/Reverse transcriptase (RNA-dependent DNA polymerase)/Retroviral aspartyl protease